MLRLNPVATNQTELKITNLRGTGLTVFFSYKTPVAYHITGEYPVITSTKHSQTTTKHINQWLFRNGFSKESIVEAHQREIESMVNYEFDSNFLEIVYGVAH